MVNLLAGSNIDQSKYPNIFKWDNFVRKHHHTYQELIDAQTYRLQRIQRGFLSLSYPKFYHTQLLTLQLFKKKQEVGEVDQNQVNIYKQIDPCVATHFNRTFNSKVRWPVLGLGVGGFVMAYTSYINCSIPARVVMTAVPIFIDWLRNTRDAKDEHKTLNFLNWVVGYRKAKCFAELHKNEFSSQETKKVLGNRNLLQLGNQMVTLAGK